MSVKILIVDDSSFVRQHVRRVLEEAQFDVIEAADGDQALEVLAANGDVALVICDVNMPRRSGLEVLEVLSQETGAPKVPVVMLTTEGQHELILRAKALGAKGWVVKPFKPEMLVLTARKLTGTLRAA
jgi:two-component system chemotaxis response regulator CheY